MGKWFVITAEETTNLIKNPSFELDAANWSISGTGATIARTNERAAAGDYALRVTEGSATAVLTSSDTVTLANGESLSASVALFLPSANYVVGDVTVRLYDTTNAAVRVSANPGAVGSWQIVEVTWTNNTGSNATVKLDVVSTVADSSSTFDVDRAQLEKLSYNTTYCDGDQPGCSWNGAFHASTSTRDGETRAGGRPVDLETLGLYLESMTGIGVPPVNTISAERALLDGREFQRQKFGARFFRLSSRLIGSSLSNLHALRAAIWGKIRPENDGNDPVIFEYRGAATRKRIAARYFSGFDFGKKDGFTEFVSVQYVADDPFWFGLLDESVSLSTSGTSTHKYLAARIGGDWSRLDTNWTGSFASMDQLFVDEKTGYLYVVGSFSNVDGVSAADNVFRIPLPDGAVADIGAGNNPIRDVAVAPNGNVWICGTLTTIDGVSNAGVAEWDGTSWTGHAPTLGAGTNAPTSIAVAADGTVYITGELSSWGSVTTDVAKYDGTTWAALGSGFNNTGELVRIGPDGNPYFIGNFTTANGMTVNRIAYWNGTTFVALGSGLNGLPYDLAWDARGLLYVVGAFTTAGGQTANRAAAWNGRAWSQLGNGLDATVHAVDVDGDGIAYIGGSMTGENDGISGASLIMGWNGYNWFHADASFGSFSAADDVAVRPNGDLFVSFRGASTTNRSAINTIDNAGTARAYPIVRIQRTGGDGARIKYLSNLSIDGAELFFSYALADGETLTIDFRPGKRSVVSSFSGSVAGVLPNSDLTGFYLKPGENRISVFVDPDNSPTVSASIRWTPQFAGADD